MTLPYLLVQLIQGFMGDIIIDYDVILHIYLAQTDCDLNDECLSLVYDP
jgi:hypothetical protein